MRNAEMCLSKLSSWMWASYKNDILFLCSNIFKVYNIQMYEDAKVSSKT